MGLAADAALFGLAWGVVISAARAVRGRLQRHAGLFAACDYDLSGLAPGAACPECGPEPHQPAVPPDRP